MSNLRQLFDQHATEEAGSRFQKQFAEFVADNKHDIVVETGAGISTLFLLDKMKDGKLYSIDTKAWCGFEVEHDNYELISADSLDAMLPLFIKTGLWDIFIHDSNHDIKWQTYEYEFGYACLRAGGYIASDDHSWGGHNAWKNFLENHDLHSFKIGDIEVAQKPLYAMQATDMESYHKECIALAENVEHIWFEAGNKNSEVIWDTRALKNSPQQ